MKGEPMTPDELKRLEEQTVEAFKAKRLNPNTEIEMWNPNNPNADWYVLPAPNWNPGIFYRIKPTPKTVEAREWDAYVDKRGKLWSKEEIEEYHGKDETGAWLTPIRVREWNMVEDKDGELWSKEQAEQLGDRIKAEAGFKPIRVREVINTPKEPKERREFKSWIKDTDDRAFPFRSQKSAERWKQDGYRLVTLVEKGGGE